MDGHGVTISFKEIYDEVKKTSGQLDNISTRLGKVEVKLQKQEDNRTSFWQKLTIVVIAAFIPVGLSVLYFVAKNGGL